MGKHRSSVPEMANNGSNVRWKNQQPNVRNLMGLMNGYSPDQVQSPNQLGGLMDQLGNDNSMQNPSQPSHVNEYNTSNRTHPNAYQAQMQREVLRQRQQALLFAGQHVNAYIEWSLCYMCP
eukprot:UN23554